MKRISKALVALTSVFGLSWCLTSNAAITGDWYITCVGSYYEIHNYSPSPTLVENTSGSDCNVYDGMGVTGSAEGPSTYDWDYNGSSIDCGYTKMVYLPTISGYFTGFPDTPGENCLNGSYGKQIGETVFEFDMTGPASPVCQTV